MGDVLSRLVGPHNVLARGRSHQVRACLALVISGHRAHLPDVDPAHLPAAYALELVALTERWGVDRDALLTPLGIPIESLRDPLARVPLKTCEALIARACAMTGEPALALYMGMQMRLSSHGFLGFAAMTAGTVREALDLAARFSLVRTTAIGLYVCVEGDTAALVLEERSPLDGLREFAVISLFVGIAQIAEVITGKRLSGAAECTFEEPSYMRRFAGLMTDPMRFSQPANRLVFPASHLDVPIVSADPIAMQLARAQCERELAALVLAGGLVGRAREAIDGADDTFRSLDEVARTLHMSTRTLKRTLASHGTTFSALVDEKRRQRALLLIAQRDLALGEIAYRLGYSDVANFTRAFRRWTGKTPAAFRDDA